MIFGVLVILVVTYLLHILSVGIPQMRTDAEMDRIKQENSRRTQELLRRENRK